MGLRPPETMGAARVKDHVPTLATSSSEESNEYGATMSNGNSNGHVATAQHDHSYQIRVTAKFITLSVLSSILLALAVGRASRLFLLDGPRNAVLMARRQSTLWPDYAHDSSRLPSLVARDGELVPAGRYTSMNFDPSRSSPGSSFLNNKRVCARGQDGIETCSIQESTEKVPQGKGIPEIPGAEHLMVDMCNLEAAFLNSEQRLATAMINSIQDAGLTLLSYHCHALVPAGVSCVGILRQNYISFHTWPVEGVITLDLVSGPDSNLPALKMLQKNFGIPRAGQEPSMRWSHRLRGFHPTYHEVAQIFRGTDIGLIVLDSLSNEYKHEVASVETKFQRIDIYDALDTVYRESGQALDFYKRSLSGDDSYFSKNPVLFRPERIVLLDGWLQSTFFGEAAYHEALVHPGMFAHPNPKRVAIIGGGEAATLREVLKHNTVEEAIMIEIDEMMVKVSREHLPEWSDCSDLVGSASWCVEDPRSTMFFEDALGWFAKRYSKRYSSEAKLDVVIIDALDPESEVPFAEQLYKNDRVMNSIFNSLSENGILIIQLGEAPIQIDPDETFSMFKNRAATTALLERVGFESIQVYEESHCLFRAPWTFFVAFKSYRTRKEWYANEAQFNLEMMKRAVQTKSGQSPFRYFDGATMESYHVPSRQMEEVFCRRQPTPHACLEDYHYNPEYPNFHEDSSVEVKMSSVSDYAGRGVYAKIDIPERAYIAAETTCHSVRFMPSTVALIEDMESAEIDQGIDAIESYMHGYGYSSRLFGEPEVVVDSGLMTFSNHGCKGSYNQDESCPIDEFTADPYAMPDYLNGKSHNGSTLFNPVIDRHLGHAENRNKRNVEAGEELLSNYLFYIGSEEHWYEDVIGLRNVCSGLESGSVTQYEQADD